MFLVFSENENFHFFFFFQVFIFLCKISNNVVFFHWKVKGIWKKSFLSNCENCVFLYFFKKTWKKTEVGQLQTKKFCGKYLWVVSTSSKNFFFVDLVKGIKKFSWNNKKQHQKVLFFKSPVYPLLVCLFLLSLSHEVSRVQP